MAKDQNKGELTISVDFRFNFDGLKEKKYQYVRYATTIFIYIYERRVV
jgi:hypothetical protein